MQNLIQPIGRFAPSPTGALHFGSLVTAVGSYLHSKSQGGLWLVRMEDLDTPRMQAGASDDILRLLDCYGLHWDGHVVYQQYRRAIYQDIVDQLLTQKNAYPCGCTRQSIRQYWRDKGQKNTTTYPNICRNGLPAGKSPRAVRIKTASHDMTFTDVVQGKTSQPVADFIICRADGIIAYQLAVVVDDAWQNITQVIRGTDLLDSTPRQIALQQQLNYPTPVYAHLPLVLNATGQKLSKQNLAPALDTQAILKTLYMSLQFLNQSPPIELLDGDINSFWTWAIAHWDIHHVKSASRVFATTSTMQNG